MIDRRTPPSEASRGPEKHEFDLTALFRRRPNPGRPTPARPAMSRRHHGRSRHARGRSDDAPRSQAQTEPRPSEPRTGIVGAELPNRPAAGEPVPDVGPTHVSAGEPNGNGHSHQPNDAIDANGGPRSGCTAPQLRRFIKSRPYVPMHELRRRFGINGAEDDVTPLPIDDASVYVGLPERECRLLGELVRGGEVGYELSLDPRTPIVVGVYPMRPVPRL